MMLLISCTSGLFSRGEVLLERNWDSFARRQGWVETWTLAGSGLAIVGVIVVKKGNARGNEACMDCVVGR